MGAPTWAKDVVVNKQVKGIDVSAWQPDITQVDWHQLKAIYGVQFAFIKATEGTGYVSRTFADDFEQAKAAGIIRGAYHFYSRGVDAVRQADHFMNTAVRAGWTPRQDLPLVFDLEHPQGLNPSDIDPSRKIMDMIEKATGVKPILYCGAYAYNEMARGQKTGLEQYPLWLPMYRSADPFIPKDFEKLYFWQFTDRGNSTEGPIDFNWWNGTLDELKSFVTGGSYEKPINQYESDKKLVLDKMVSGEKELTRAICRLIANNRGWFEYRN